MEELVKLLNEELQYEKHGLLEDYIDIHVSSVRKSARCPYCECMSEKAYSKATRTKGFADSGQESKTDIVEPQIFLQECELRLQDLCGAI